MVVYALYKKRKDIFVLRKTDMLPCLISGMFGVGICSTSAAFAMGRIPIGLTFLLINTAPFWVMILARIFWKERVTWFQVLALGIGISGIWLAVGGVKFQPYNVMGLIAALGAGFGYAIYVLNGKHGMGKEDPLKAYVQMFLWGALCLWIFFFATGQIGMLMITDWEAWLSVLYLTIFPGIGAFGILMLSLRVVSGGVAAIVSMTEIPFAMFWSWLFLSEIPSSSALKGGSLIVIAVVLLSLEKTLTPGTITGLFRIGDRSE
jgi:drug/metabolite transporter (DMT)-like permease